MRRREFITLLGVAAAWPLAARAQQQEGMRRVGMLTGIRGEDTQTKARIAAFLQELQKLGWTEGRNPYGADRIHYRHRPDRGGFYQ
jgi:putative ABC transport system substrate-binding protein